MKHIILLILLTLGVWADNAIPSSVDKKQTWARIIIDQFLEDGNKLRALYYSYDNPQKIYDNVWNLKTGMLESSKRYELDDGESEPILHKHENCYIKNDSDNKQLLSIYNKDRQVKSTINLPPKMLIWSKNSDCSYLAVRNYKNGKLYLYDTNTNIYQDIFPEDVNTTTSIKEPTFLINSNQKFLIAMTSNNGIRNIVKIDLKTLKKTSFENSSDTYIMMAIPNSSNFITASILEDDTVQYRVWDSITNHMIFTFNSDKKAVTVRKKDWPTFIRSADHLWDITDDGSELITRNNIADADIVKRWDLNTGQLIATYTTHGNRDFDLSDNKKLAAASNQSYIELLDADTKKTIAKLYFKTDETWSYEKQETFENISNR